MRHETPSPTSSTKTFSTLSSFRFPKLPNGFKRILLAVVLILSICGVSIAVFYGTYIAQNRQTVDSEASTEPEIVLENEYGFGEENEILKYESYDDVSVTALDKFSKMQKTSKMGRQSSSGEPNDPYFFNQYYLNSTGQTFRDDSIMNITGKEGEPVIRTAKDDIDIDALEIWQKYEETFRRDPQKEVIVAVWGSGVDHAHADLQNSIWINLGEFSTDRFPGIDANNDGKLMFGELAMYRRADGTRALLDYNRDGNTDLLDIFESSAPFEDGVDNDNNGYVDDFTGWNFDKRNNFTHPDIDITHQGKKYKNTHETVVAGILAAETNNNIGMSGICVNCRLLIIQDWFARPLGVTPSFVDQIDYAVRSGAKIMNISYDLAYIDSVREGLKKARENNLLIVAAAGNSAERKKLYPCADPTVLCVTGIDYLGNKWYRSQFGDWININAPSSMMLSTNLTTNLPLLGMPFHNERYVFTSGTSYATPLAAGTIAYIHSKTGEDVFQIADKLVKTADEQLIAGGSRAQEIGLGTLSLKNFAENKIDSPKSTFYYHNMDVDLSRLLSNNQLIIRPTYGSLTSLETPEVGGRLTSSSNSFSIRNANVRYKNTSFLQTLEQQRPIVLQLLPSHPFMETYAFTQRFISRNIDQSVEFQYEFRQDNADLELTLVPEIAYSKNLPNEAKITFTLKNNGETRISNPKVHMEFLSGSTQYIRHVPV